MAKLLKNPSEITRLDEAIFLNDQVDLLPYNREYEIDRSSFTLTTVVLGEGEFGNVLKGEIKLDDSGLRYKTVAVKVPKRKLF